ncbi:hypothetical protein MHU86_12901 [Fragilaria crotonensis]|nr:hypothetical protein MHU86_12901 [Fragilaria crotonensis]
MQIDPSPLTAAGIDFSVLECVARNAVSSEVTIPGSSKTSKVVVFTVGGSYSMDDVRPNNGFYPDEDNGSTLVIFNTSDDVRLIFSNNRKFGPSVLAPFSKVTIDDNNDFTDGYVVAREFVSTKTAQQLHGDAFQGDVACATGSSPTGTTSATPLPTTALVAPPPSSYPTGAPTGASTVDPTGAPTPSPTAFPTGSSPATPSPTVAAQSYSCILPSVVSEFSVISEGNAIINAQNFNGLGLLIGGNLDRTNNNAGNIYQKSFVAGTRSGAWNWNPNPVLAGPFNTLVDFEQLRYISRNAVSSTAADGSRVIVINSGGTFTSAAQLSSDLKPWIDRYLVIFNTDLDVTLDFGTNGINFSALAPRSKLSVNVNSGDVRGFLAAREVVVSSTTNMVWQSYQYAGQPLCPTITGPPVPTSAPTPAPTSAALPTAPTPPGVCACTLPDYLKQKKWTLITKGDALHSAHSVYTGLAIGGTLSVYEPTTSKTVSYMSYMQAIFPATSYGINFNGGMQIDPSPLTAAGIDFSVLECVARNAVSSEVTIPGSSKTSKVVVFTVGGSYSMDDVRPNNGFYPDEDNGSTLVIFNTSDDVRLIFSNNRKFGPSVLAPFSKVTIDDNNDFTDGYVVAREFVSTKTAQQLHGDAFQGTTSC